MALPSLATLEIGAGKRRSVSSTGHFGERLDSAHMSVSLIALSRVILGKDVAVLSTVAASNHGADLLNQLLASTQRLAVAAGGEASSNLSVANLTTFFNITGSTLMRKSSFDMLFGLPDRISWVTARAVYTAILEALAHVRATPSGVAVESLLMASAAASDTSPADVIGVFVAEVEAHAAHRLATAPRMAVGVESGVGSTSSSSNRTTSPFAPPPTPPLSPMPLPLAAFAIDSSQSLAINLMQLLEYRLRRPPPQEC